MRNLENVVGSIGVYIIQTHMVYKNTINVSETEEYSRWGINISTAPLTPIYHYNLT